MIKLRLLENISLLILGCAGSLLLRGLFSSCGEQGRLSSSGAWPYCGSFFAAEHTLQVRGLQDLWFTGLVARRCVGSSGIRDQTCVSSIARRILYH